MLVISEEEVRRCLSIKDAVKINADAFKKESLKQATVPPRISISLEQYSGVTLFKPAHVQGAGLGLKVVSTRPNNGKLGLPGIPAVILLCDEETGVATAIMDGTYLTALRTAAGSGAATDALALPDAKNLLVFGAGLQAEVHIEAMICVRGIKKVGVWNRTHENAEQLCQKMSARFPDVSFSPVEDIQAAVSSADVIVTATASENPLFDGAWLKPGCHINGVGSFRPSMQELDVTAVKKCRVVVDQGGAVEAGDLKTPLDSGQISKEHILGNIGDLLLGNFVGRRSSSDITFFKSVGTAVQDIATAAVVLKNAKALNLGTNVQL